MIMQIVFIVKPNFYDLTNNFLVATRHANTAICRYDDALLRDLIVFIVKFILFLHS